MTDEERKALVERAELLTDGNAWPSTVELVCDLRDQIIADGNRIAELEAWKDAEEAHHLLLTQQIAEKERLLNVAALWAADLMANQSQKSKKR